MPILDIEIVGARPSPPDPTLAGDLAERCGEIFASRPQGTWVKLRYLDPTDYAENAGGPPAGLLPVFVSVLEARRSEDPRRLVPDLAQAIADRVGVGAQNVHVVLAPPAAGRIAFGGILRE